MFVRILEWLKTPESPSGKRHISRDWGIRVHACNPIYLALWNTAVVPEDDGKQDAGLNPKIEVYVGYKFVLS